MSHFIVNPGEYLVPILVLMAVISVLISSARNWFAAKRLFDRQQLDDDHFARLFGDATKGETAARARTVLAKNLDLNLDGLRPQDRLDDDLRAGIGANVDLFWSLEEEFGIECEVENLEVFEATTAKLITFSDLVEYVHEKRAVVDTSATGADTRPGDDEKGIDGTRIIIVCWFSGIGLLLVSGLIDSDGLMKFALALAFAPLLVGLLYVIVEGVRDAVELYREEGGAGFAKLPFSSALWFVHMGVLIAFAAGIAWLLSSLFLE